MAAVVRQWPLVLLLAALALFDLEASVRLGAAGWGWVALGCGVTAALALLAPARPVLAALGAAVTVAGWSVLLRLLGAELVAGLAVTELGALAIIVVVVVRRLPPPVAAGLVALILGAGVAATQVRPGYWELPEGSAPEPWWSVSLSGLAMTVLPVWCGWWMRGRDRQRARAHRDAAVAARQAERLNLATELHEVMAYQVGRMVAQVREAQAGHATDPGAPARVLPAIEQSGMETLSTMRRLVAELRDADQPAAPRAPATDLGAELHALAAAGDPPARVTLDLSEPVGGELVTSVLRLVRESVADARRHGAGVREITTSVRAGEHTLRLEIRDDGRSTGRRRGGLGLIRMRERVRLLGGRFAAGPAPGGGWQVTAELPLRPGGR